MEFDTYYAITPTFEYKVWDNEKFINESHDTPGKNCEEGFSYNSGDNHDFLSVDEIRELIIKHVPGGEQLYS